MHVLTAMFIFVQNFIFTECGKFEFIPSSNKPLKNSLEMNYILKPTSLSVIPLATTTEEVIEFMDVHSKTKVVRKNLTKQNYENSINISLPIEHVFDVVHKIFWDENIPKFKSNITGEEVNQVRLEVKCQHSQLHTRVWSCKDKTVIPADHVCDRHKHCPDGSDEYSGLCQGKETIAMYIMKIILSSKYFLGIIVFSISIVSKYCVKNYLPEEDLDEDKPLASTVDQNSVATNAEGISLVNKAPNTTHEEARKKTQDMIDKLRTIFNKINSDNIQERIKDHLPNDIISFVGS